MATDEDLLEAEWESVADGSSDMNLAPAPTQQAPANLF